MNNKIGHLGQQREFSRGIKSTGGVEVITQATMYLDDDGGYILHQSYWDAHLFGYLSSKYGARTKLNDRLGLDTNWEHLPPLIHPI